MQVESSILKLVQTELVHWFNVMLNVKERGIKDAVT